MRIQLIPRASDLRKASVCEIADAASFAHMCYFLAVPWDTSACLGFAQPPTLCMHVDNDAIERSEARAYLQFDFVLLAAALR